jgi:hypothetical protein
MMNGKLIHPTVIERKIGIKINWLLNLARLLQAVIHGRNKIPARIKSQG